MKKFHAAALVALIGASLAQPAPAQNNVFMADVIGQAVARSMNSAWPENCLSLKWPEKAKSVQRFARDAEPGLRAYLALAAGGSDPSSAYKRTWAERWSLDGAVTQDLKAVRDPWASRIERLETVGLMLGRSEVFGHGIWRAYDMHNELLGTYEAEMIRKTKGYAIGRLKLWSPGKEDQADAPTPYCAEPGDHERYLAAKVEAEAERERRRAEREARRNASS